MQKINDCINLHYIPMKKLKTSTIGVYIHTPLTEETASLNYVLAGVLKRGCKLCKNTQEIEDYLDNLYGASLKKGCIKKGEDQIICFMIESITEKYAPDNEQLFEKMMKLLLSVVFEPVTENGAFSKEFVAQVKKNSIEHIESIKNDKRSYASKRCISEMCAGTAFSIPSYGTVEGVKAVDEENLYQHYKKIIQSSKIDIYISGECDEEGASRIISEYLPEGEYKPVSIKFDGIIKKHDEVKNIEEKMDVTQGKLSMGFVTGIQGDSDDYFALMVANSIFGAGAHSKLFNNVREKLSLCYYASSTTDRFKGFMVVNSGIEFENYQKAYDEILNQLEDVKKGNISELEYISSINAIVNSLKSCFDDQFAMQSYCLSEDILKTGITLEECIEKIQKVTVEDVVRVASGIELDTVYFLKGVDC